MATETIDEEQMRWVRNIAFNLMPQHSTRYNVSDLIQEGTFGLMEAVKRYDPSKGASLKTYAGIRITGCIKDFLRSESDLNRRMHKVMSRRSKLPFGCENEESEISSGMDISEEECRDLIRDALGINSKMRLEQIHDVQDLNYSRDPFEIVYSMELIELIEGYFSTVSYRDKMIVNMHFLDRKNNEQISREFNISPSRVTQIVKSVVENLSLWVQMKTSYNTEYLINEMNTCQT